MSGLLVRDARFVLADGATIDGWLRASDGVITALGTGDEQSPRADEVYDAGGRVVLPGLIDTHFHVGFHSAERDFETETASAALGGVTTVCRYFRHLGPYVPSLGDEIELGERTSHVDFAIHLGLLTDDQLARLDTWIADYGIRSFKMYTCYKDSEGAALGIRGQDDGFLLDAFRALAAAGDVVANVHAENQEIVDRETSRLRASSPGAGDLAAWSMARPPIAEAEAIRRVGFLARSAGCELFIPHVSSDAALEAVRAARAEGGRVAAETCPHYLALDVDAPAGVLAKINPPIRPATEASGLWPALHDGEIDVVGSDHGTTMRAAKRPGDPWASAPGFTGVATILPVLLGRGVAAGRIDLGTIARLQARAAAVFRLPAKGRIEPGFDADLVVVDTEAERPVAWQALGSASDFTVFEGELLRGWPVATFVRGALVARAGKVVGPQGWGRYIRR